MTTTTTTLFAAVILALIAAASPAHGLGGSATTVAVVYSTATVCGLVADEGNQHIQCWRDGHVTKISPETSFDYIAGGRDTFCAVRSGGFSLLCFNSSLAPKRLYNSYSILLEDLTVGDDQICALTNGTRSVICWRGDRNTNSSQFPDQSHQFKSISSGLGFSCGVLANKNTVTCWGSNSIMASFIQSQFTNLSMSNIVVGGSHACGFNLTGFLICKGSNSSNLLPDGVDIHSNSAYEYSRLAVGANHACAIRSSNGSVVCWGGDGEFGSNVTVGVSFESLVAGLNFTCGVTTSDFSIICWGTGWPSGFGAKLGLPKVLPGPCVQSTCSECGIYPQSQILCHGSGSICRICSVPISMPPKEPLPLPPPTVNPTQSSPSRGLRKGLLAFAIVGSVGAFSGICTMIYCLWTGVCFGKKKIHNSVQPTITGSNANNGQTSNSSPPSRSSTIRRQGSRLMRRQRSGTSSKHTDRAEEFSFSDLVAATNNFSLENKIGEGSFGVVYRAKLWDGREVAIKRGGTGPKTQKFQEKERAFESELAFLSRLHHKHLVSLVGYCEDRDERLLVYEYMKNGALYDHLHKNNVEKSSTLLNSWKMRIKISLDAARGIEYLHNYAVPPIIHRDIKSSNILLDANWTARVSDFGLSLMGPESDRDFRPTKAAGTVGYIDPEYYSLNVLTAKSDVYGLGVVLLELLTGKRAIFKSGENGGEPTRVVDFALPAIMAGEMGRILDPRVGPPLVNEAEAVELMAYTALHCVNLEGKDRPTMSDVVASLERALALCDDSHGSISSGPISIGSE
ncbi:Serine/threonine-protein kinase-like protein CCR3 precursor [Actinidia chinensis var. chinensis]|uniref:non-specific serine/threonine protein kinase n=1 Tax=Actinidia chinensis var. chinensis TaxID=1590841 RepID=A0A2R6RR90_ACTCC|nr:Serine/threonine-protein kinase-like protein CCR3 precursor [Actinidia chinensis var. chinensis]